MAADKEPTQTPAQNVAADDDDDEDPEEYSVEAIRGKRRNPKTGGFEYLIKWENYPETDNTWEPSEHLKCPEIIQRFEESEKNKKRKKRVERQTNNKKARTDIYQPSTSRAALDERDVFLEKDDDDIDEDDDEDNENRPARLNETNRRPQQKQQQAQANGEPARPKGFDRGLPLESIIAATTDQFEKLWFLVKWDGRNEVELIDNDEMEEKVPRELCRWYRSRLLWSIGGPSDQTDSQLIEQQMRELERARQRV